MSRPMACLPKALEHLISNQSWIQIYDFLPKKFFTQGEGFDDDALKLFCEIHRLQVIQILKYQSEYSSQIEKFNKIIINLKSETGPGHWEFMTGENPRLNNSKGIGGVFIIGNPGEDLTSVFQIGFYKTKKFRPLSKEISCGSGYFEEPVLLETLELKLIKESEEILELNKCISDKKSINESLRLEKNELNSEVNRLVKQMSNNSNQIVDSSTSETLESKIIRLSEKIIGIENIIKYHELRIYHFRSIRAKLIFSVEELKSKIK
jgi:hypothetical protein